jgi:hypothetical protein
VAAQKAKLDRTSLVQNLKVREKWRLLEELKKRFPEEVLREKTKGNLSFESPDRETDLAVHV